MLIAFVHRIRLTPVSKLVKARDIPTKLGEKATDTLANEGTEVTDKLAKCTVFANEVLHHAVEGQEGLILGGREELDT